MARGLRASVECNDLIAFEKMLDNLEVKAARRVVSRSQKVAAELMWKQTRRAAPVDMGLLLSSLTVLPLRRKKGRVGFRIGYTNVQQIVEKSSWQGKRGFYPAFVEYGTKNHPPHPFMRPAFDANKESAKAAIIEELRKGIIKEAQKQTIGAAISRFAKKSGITKLNKRVKKVGKKIIKKGRKQTRKASRRISKAMKKFR